MSATLGSGLRVDKSPTKTINNPEYREEMKAASAEDEKQTRLKADWARAEIQQLEDKGSGLTWLYDELSCVVREIRREATVKGFSQLMEQTDGSIVDVLVNKMNAAVFYKDIPLTYHEAIQKGKVKAIHDWIGCAKSIENIEGMLDQLFNARR